MDNEKLQVAYLIMQEASGIKEGDTVKVLRNAETHEMGWGNSWTPEMTKNIGKKLIVSYIGVENTGINLDGQCYPFFVLKKVESAKPKDDIESFIDSCGDFGCQKDNIKKLVKLLLKEIKK